MRRNALPPKKLSSSDPLRAQLANEIESYHESANLYLKTFEEIEIIHLKCYKQNCREKVFFECKCLAQATFICQTHIATHMIEDVSKTHAPTVLDPKIYNQEWDNVANYFHEYNSDLKNIKKVLVSKVTEYFEQINKDVSKLLANINAIISINNHKILDITSTNLKKLENLTQLQSDSLKELTLKFYKTEISEICSDIIQAEINDWNANMINNKISKIQRIDYKLDQNLLYVDEYDRLEHISLKKSSHDKLTESILHWCQWQSNKVHYFDCWNNAQKSITINGLNILKLSSSISIDYNFILLCGGYPDDDIPRSNERMSKVFKINLETQSFQTLTSMNTGRAGFCMTYMNGFYYVLGGGDYLCNNLKNGERFSLENDRWENIADLKHPRSSSTCVSVSKENCIYLIGGRDTKSKLDEKIEKYDAALNMWILVKIQKHILSYNLGACLLPNSNFMLIFGGQDINAKCQIECYLYNFRTNKVANTKPISSVYNGVFNIPMIVNDKVYCYFYRTNSERELSVYDIKSGVWSIKP